MAPRTALPSEQEADAHAGGQSPAVLDHLERTGAIRFGRRVAKVILVYDDGSRVAADLPLPAPAAKDWTLTKAGAAIIEVLAREGRPLKGAAIAALAKYKYNGSFRSALKGLETQGEISHDEDDGYELVG